MLDLLLDSLQRRMRTMHSLYYQAVGSMDLEHVNHFEREGVLPIAFSLFHYTNMEDVCFMAITGVAPIWDADRQAKVQMAINDHGKHRTVGEARDEGTDIEPRDRNSVSRFRARLDCAREQCRPPDDVRQ